MTSLRRLGPDLNAYTLPFDQALLADIRQSYQREIEPVLTDPAAVPYLEGGVFYSEPIGSAPSPYYLFTYDTFPLLWFSSNRADVFALYRRFFEQAELGRAIAPLVDHQRHIVMYCGFLVVGDRAEDPMWHYDYRPGANAYTLIAPLFALDPGHGHLLYRQGDKTRRYVYTPGEAVIFGEGFYHSTEPYEPCGKIRVLLSMTFGTDKWDHWDTLKENIAEQSCYYVQPCGHVAGSCNCESRWRRRQRMLKGIRNFFRPD